MSTAEVMNSLLCDAATENRLPYAGRWQRAAEAITGADCILIGAGAGLSAAAGLSYDGAAFRQAFRAWTERYGLTDLYSSSFYPWASEEELWAYWAAHIAFVRLRPAALPLYKALREMVRGRDYFVITTNVDGQFAKAGFAPERVFTTQGDLAEMQTISGRPCRVYSDTAMVERMTAATENCRIPTALVPRCQGNGEPMRPHIRVNETFVEDIHWQRQEAAYRRFLRAAEGRRLVLLELGVGFSTPTIIRFPFEQMARDLARTTLIRFNRYESAPLLRGIPNFIPFDEELSVALLSSLTL